jgi:DNA-binding transcriptional LysR family regulator
LVYFAAPSYLDAHSPIEHAIDLEKHQCLTYSLATPSNVWSFPVKDAVQKVKVNEYIRSDSPDMLVQMARLGQGVAAMPRWMIEKDLSDGRLIQVLADLSTLKRPMYLVYKNVEHQPQRIRAFIDFLSDYFISTKANT